MKTKIRSPRCHIAPIALALAAFLVFAAGLKAADTLSLDPLRAEMRAGNSNAAVALADKIIAAKDSTTDEAGYLKTVAFFNAKKYPEAIAAADQLAEALPKSIWRYKATFLKAQSLVEQKQFKEAAVLYQGEATRLLAAERKQGLVDVIATFADKLATPPDPNVPDSPKPDFRKAYNLYSKALGMEISRELRDELMFKKARAIQQAGDHGQAAQDFQAYLTEFDPAWTGPAGSGAARQVRQNPPPAGKHVAYAHYRLAEAQIQMGSLVAGRMELEDLLKRINADTDGKAPEIHAELAMDEGKKLPAEIRWLMVRSYFTELDGTGATISNLRQNANFNGNALVTQFIGNTGGLPTTDSTLYVLRDGDLAAALKVCREYLAAFPEGSRAVRAKWMMAEGCQNAGRADDAIKIYREFIAGQDFRLPVGDAAQKYDEEL
ncbi:MAG TPA: tetratricopeptide repeat protein, partial [Verrucomicrobiae bacterium]